MILPSSASLILSAVQQLIKLGNRLDRLMAQRTAVESQLVLAMPTVRLGDADLQLELVKDALAATAGQQPDPFGADRAAFQQQLAAPSAQFDALFAKYFPDQVSSLVVSPDAAKLEQLQQAFPGLDWKDPGVRIAAFAIAAGPNDPQITYTARIALAVADTLLEFGADNTALFVRDARLQGVVHSVLERFAQPDWAGFTAWNPLLQTALKAALNAALDVAADLPEENPWLDAVLDALVQARASASNPDDFLLGLVQGEGVSRLLAQGLLVASDRLGTAGASSFKLVAADVLQAAAPFLQQQANPDLAQFFRDHWADLLRAGLTSLDRHGDQLLSPGKPLLNGVLKALVQRLATTPATQLLSNETLFALADTVIEVVARNPSELASLTTKPWLGELLVAAAQSAQQLTAKNLFTAAAADALLRDALGVIARHPDLIVRGNGLPVTLVQTVFSAVAALPRLDARAIGETVVRAALEAIAADATLAAKPFGALVAGVATQLADFVQQGQFTREQAASIAAAAIAAIARNPKLLGGADAKIVGAVLAAVQQSLPPDSPWTGDRAVEIAKQLLAAVARHGATAASQPLAQFQQQLSLVLTAGLQVAEAELGTSAHLDDVPLILGGLAGRALRHQLTDLSASSPAFTSAFREIAASLPAA